ncbi:glycoside hydrolase family 43 protein [Sphaerochaeta sp.]|uniref:glycoside hydrolase family 43 protein n=1 Tax=Sphaerochaeta sp. TaxID=1972642 RepID=UPI002FCB896A
MQLTDIQMRDPFILADELTKRYYLYGTTDVEPWKIQGVSFEAYQSSDLKHWEGPVTVFKPESGFWGTHNFWAPEVHVFQDSYYMFASFKSNDHCRGTQILVSDSPLGPFRPVSPQPATPLSWECLDGTFFVDDAGQNWIVFCHEWVQVNDGEVCAQRLSEHLDAPIGEPILLFRASEAPWPKLLARRDGSNLVDARVTDGPFLHHLEDGQLLMLWSSVAPNGYAMGYAVSKNGSLLGPWQQQQEPLITGDGGHGMIFRSFEGRLYLTYHSPNKTPNERPFFVELEEVEGGLRCR